MRSTSIAIFLICVATVLLTDCTKSDPKPTVCYLTGINDNLGTTTLIYNISHQVVTIVDYSGASGVTRTMQLTYSSSGEMMTGTFDDGGTWVYSYDSVHRLIQRTSSPGGELLTVEYNDLGQTILITHVNPHCSPCNYTREFTYPNSETRNYSQQTWTNSSGTTLYSYEYDDHPNPYNQFYQLRYLYLSPQTDNNITKLTENGPSGKAVYTYTYSYNELGYPTMMSSYGWTNTYTYSCQ